MSRHRIELLIALVLFTVVSAAVWTSSQADARGFVGPGASSHLSATRPGASPTSGDPDIGQGLTPQPPKAPNKSSGGGNANGHGFGGWSHWAGRIWATLYMRAAL
jgi:hypothetical protein